MDFSKLDGILDAVEQESRQASPSHNNLARLTGMAFRELVEQLKPAKQVEIVTVSSSLGSTVTLNEPEDEKTKKALRSKKTKVQDQ